MKKTRDKKDKIGFEEIMRQNPCDDCESYCCKFLLIPHPAPRKLMDIDYLKYMLGFNKIAMLLSKDGQWKAMVEVDCIHFDKDKKRCKVHNTSQQPKTCSYYNPHSCWYRESFNKGENRDIIRIDISNFDKFTEILTFTEGGEITNIPTFESLYDHIHG